MDHTLWHDVSLYVWPARAKGFQRPATLKRRIGYHEEKDEEEEDMPDAPRIKVDDRALSSS